MNLFKSLLLTICASVLLTACMTTGPATTQEERRDVLYSCNCGPQCKCNSVSLKPGDCKCGSKMAWGHVIKVEGNEAIVCQCKEGCTCSIDPKDPTKCGCGMAVKRVNLQGTGIYFCNCGGTCACNTLSESPAGCKCGMPLKKTE
jgi:hypothetical protein